MVAKLDNMWNLILSSSYFVVALDLRIHPILLTLVSYEIMASWLTYQEVVRSYHLRKLDTNLWEIRCESL